MSNIQQLLDQTNEHMRATDAKRDRIYYLYIIVFGSFITFYKDLSLDPSVVIIANIVLVLFGSGITFIIVNYHAWQVLYVSTAIVFQKMINREIREIDDGKIHEISKEIDTLSAFELCWGASSVIYDTVLVMNYMVGVLLFHNVTKYYGVDCWNTATVIAIMIVLTVYLYFFISIYKKRSRKVRDGFPENSWLLRS